MEYRPLKASKHRDFIAPEFGAGGTDEEAVGLKLTEIMAHPKLSALAVSVWDSLREQFSGETETPEQKETAAEAEYRMQLENMASVLEILLEETLDELELLNSDDPNMSRAIV